MAAWLLERKRTASKLASRRWRSRTKRMGGSPRFQVRLSLLKLSDNRTWKRGEPPMRFVLLLHRLDASLEAVRFLSSSQAAMVYHLEITAPDGRKLFAPQQLPSSEDIQVTAFLYAR